MAKMAVLKAVMWNPEGYKQPAGHPSTSGYSHDHGYGQEEWNNNPRWFWQGWKVFHTEACGKLREVAETGDLGMVMIASHEGSAYALGVATNVFANSRREMKLIVDSVNKHEDWPKVWQLPIVQKRFGGRQGKFLGHWGSDIAWVQWRCLPPHFYWFPEPVLLVPERITGKKKLSMHHSKYTQTTPAVLFDIIDSRLPKSRTAIREWLSSGQFTRQIGPQTEGQRTGAKKIERYGRKGGNAPTDQRFEYWVKGIRKVEPLHDRLQKLWVTHLKGKGIIPEQNRGYVDVQYVSSGTRTLCEVKPTDNLPTRYAIRIAIGQLLEYRYRNQVPDAALEIVIGKEPRRDEVAFVKSLGIKLTFFNSSAEDFVTV